MRIEFQARAPRQRKFRGTHAAAAVIALLAAVFVSGHRLITPGFLLSANELSFTGVQAGVETPAQYVSLTNPFNADLRLDSVTLRGEAGAYRFPSNGCVGKTIHPRETCKIGVSFVPPAVGKEKATLEVASINGDRRIVALTGLLNPVAPPPPPPPPPSPPPPPLDANTKPVDSTTAAASPSPAFTTASTTTQPKSKPASKSTTAPGSTQPTTQPQLPPDEPPETHIPPPPPRQPVISASLAPNPVQFPSITIGSLTVRDVTITNTGDHPFPAGQATIQGDHWNDFRIVTDPCSTHPVTSACIIRVVFLPSEAGQHRAQLLLSGGDNRYSVLLDGTATPPPMPIADLQPLRIELTQMDSEHPIELRNVGTGSLTVIGISLGGRNPDDFTLDTRNCAHAVIGRNQGCTMEVIFRADDARRARRKVSEAVVTLQDNAEGSPRMVVVTGAATSKDPKQIVWRPPETGYVFTPPPPGRGKQTPTPAQPPRGNSDTGKPAVPQKPPRQTPTPTSSLGGDSYTHQTGQSPQKPPVTPRKTNPPPRTNIQ